MKKTRLLAVVLVLSIFSMRAAAQNTDKPRLAVAEFTGNAPDDAATVREMVERVMINSTYYTIVSTYEIDQIIEQLKIAVSSIGSPDNIKKLRRENIQYIVTGTVRKQGSESFVSLRMLDVSNAILFRIVLVL